MTDSQHGFSDPDAPVMDQPLDRQAPVRIEQGAWLGNNAMVMAGVTIGRNAVVGANAVVTSDVPDTRWWSEHRRGSVARDRSTPSQGGIRDV